MSLPKLSTIFIVMCFWFAVAVAQEVPRLELGKALERELAVRQTHEYQVTLAAGEFMQVRVEQKGVDVVIILQDGSQQQLARMDSPNGKEGLEILSWIATDSAEYRVKIQTTNGAAGQYNITLATKRPATTQDKRRVEIETLFVEGCTIRKDVAKVEMAIEKLETALQGWQELSDPRMIELTLSTVIRLKKVLAIQIQKASPGFKEGLRLTGQNTPESLRAAIVKFEEEKRTAQRQENKIAEAFLLMTIGKAHIELGESEAAVALYNEALAIYQSTNDKDEEEATRFRIDIAPLEAQKARAKRQRNEKKENLHPELIVQIGHSSTIPTVTFSPNGKILATGGEDTTIKLWQVANGQELRTLSGHSDGVSSIAFSPDGKILASGSWDKTIKLWEVASGRELRTFYGHSDYVSSIAFSLDGRLLASSSLDKTVKLWDIASGKELLTLLGHSGAVMDVAFSPDGKLLVSGSADKKIKLWEIVSGKELLTLTGHSSVVRSIAFSSDGKTLASGSYDKTIKLWEVTSGQELYTLHAHSNDISSIAFTLDGKILASSSQDKTIKLWDVASRRELQTLSGHSEMVYDIAFSPDAKMLASTDGNGVIKLWEIARGKELYSLAGQASRIGGVYRLRFDSNGEVYILPAFDRESIAISADAKILASGNGHKTIKLWDITGKLDMRTLSGHSGLINAVTFSPDGKILVSVSDDKTIKLWSVASGKVVQSLPANTSVSIVFSPDGKMLASLGFGTIRLWEVSNWRELRTYNYPLSRIISSIAFSPDGKMLASFSWDNTINNLWDIATGKDISLPSPLPDWLKNIGKDNLAIINGKKFRVRIEESNKIILIDATTELTLATLAALNDKDWVVVDEEGRFDASDGALPLMHYTYGLDIIGFDQLKDEYYEPNLLQKLLGYNTEPLRAVVPLQDVKLPPEVREQKLSSDGKRLTLRLANRGGGIGKTEIFLNNKLVIPDARTVKLRQNPNVPLNEVVTLTVDLPATSFLPGKENQIKVVASNYLAAIKRGNIQSSARGVAYLDPRKNEETLPSVYALVSGVSDYEGDALDLRFAAKDAEDFSTALSLGARRLFCPPGNLQCLDKVNITTLSTNRTKAEEQPTKENFKRALGAIAAKAKPEDIVVIYLAGHGVSLGVNTDTYFYLTKEAKSAAREDLTKNYQTVAISSEELRDWLTQTEWRAGVKGIKPLKQVLILDTCAAGTAASQLALTTKRELSGDQIRAIEFLKDKTGTFVLMGSAADAPSYEASRYGQGLLTYALLQGLKGAALDKGEFVDVQTLFSYAQKEVPRMAANIGGIQRPIISAPLGRTFVIGQMTETEKSQVRLPSPKPLLLRPLLTNPETGDDDLKLIPALRKRFDAESSYELMKRSGKGEPTLVYVDDDSFPEALRLTGTYTVVGDKVRVKALLRRDGKTVATLAEVFTAKENVVDELVNAVRNALGQLRE